MKLNYEDILQIIAQANTQIDLERMHGEANLRDLGADSLDLMTILLSVQEKAGIEIPDAELDNLVSVDSICNYVNREQ